MQAQILPASIKSFQEHANPAWGHTDSVVKQVVVQENLQHPLNCTVMAVDFNSITLHLMLSMQLKSQAEPKTYGTLKTCVNLTTEIQKGGSSEDTHLAELKAASLITPDIKEKNPTLKTPCAAQANLEGAGTPGYSRTVQSRHNIARKA